MRKELENIHGLKISGASYRAVWRNLVALFGFQGAAVVVEDAVDISRARKILIKTMGKRETGHVNAFLIENITKAEKRARPYLRKTQQAENANQESGTHKKRRQIVSHEHIRLPNVEYGRGITKASALGYQPIQTVANGRRIQLRARSDWLEKNLENYLEKHWTELDFGLVGPLHLVGRQIGLSASREKVDLLARSENVIVPIELKIRRAGGSDLTQLQSYRQDLINHGESAENVLGILVAPQFSSKVLNVAKGSPGIILRWFEMRM